MRHTGSSKFWAAYDKLPPTVRTLADKSFELLKSDPEHPSLHLKKVGSYWSVRVGLKYRALGVQKESDTIVWFWIGTHAEYDHLVK